MTAQEVLEQKETFDPEYPTVSIDDAIEAMIEFANYHIQEALKEALDEVPYGGSDSISYEDVRGILTCYPITEIK